MPLRLILLVAGAIVLAIGVVWWIASASPLADPEKIRELVEDAGMLAPAAFVLVTVALFWVFLLIPPVWASPALWPLPIAFALSFIGCMLGSLAAYALGRGLGAEWAERRIPASIRKHRQKLEARPVAAIVFLRLILWANPFADLLIALTRIPFRTYVVGTALGLVLPTAAHVLIGAGGMQAARRLTPSTIVLLACAIGATIFLVLRRMRESE